jgi:hypothetical protein
METRKESAERAAGRQRRFGDLVPPGEGGESSRLHRSRVNLLGANAAQIATNANSDTQALDET